METAKSTPYKLVKRIKDSRFDVEKLHHYCLSLQVGIRDFQICVTDTRDHSCLILEDYLLVEVKTINSRLEVLAKLFENHHLLMAGFWESIKLSLKSHKFSLVPSSLFVPDSIGEYLKLNSVVNPKVESEFFYNHKSSNIVNAFAADRRLIDWIRSLYPKKEIKLIHQGSALIEGVLKSEPKSGEKTVYCIMDRSVLHVFVSQNQKLHYYNQFSIKNSKDFLKYVMLVFKEFGLDQRVQPVLIWGNLTETGETISLVKRYIKNVNFGKRPTFMKFNYMFDEVLDHQYFDLYSVYLCD
ncbi:MAG: DUF3822 family protein [Reichenbachiella sp.]